MCHKKKQQKYESNSNKVFIFFHNSLFIFPNHQIKVPHKEISDEEKLIRSYCICPWQYEIALYSSERLLSASQCLVLNDQRGRCYCSAVKEKYFYWNKRKSCDFIFHLVFPLLSLIPSFMSPLTFQNICLAFDWHLSEVNSFHLTFLPHERIQ